MHIVSMDIIVALLMGWMVTCIATAIDDDCCPEKDVGGVIYKLIALDPAMTKPPFNCKNPCVYSSEKDGNSYCFEIGALETECTAPLIPLEEEGSSTNTTDVHQDGVLIMGGIVNNTGFLDDVEVIGSCNILIQPLPQGVQTAAAALGEESKPYICGGINSSVSSIAITVPDCYIRENATGMWVVGPFMKTARSYFTLTRVGSYLVALGGWNYENKFTDTYEILELDPKKTSSWVQTINYTLTTARAGHCAVAISSSKLMVIGGHSGSALLNSVEILDITTGHFISGNNLLEAIYGHQCTIYDGKIWLTGGDTGSSNYSDKVYSLYFSGDPSSSHWIPRKPMKHARRYHVAAVIGGLLTVHSGGGPGQDHRETLINDEWSPLSFSSDNRKYGTAFVSLKC